jgi:putative NIF3 family GTP cyclohydrolase 1 type 2
MHRFIVFKKILRNFKPLISQSKANLTSIDISSSSKMNLLTVVKRLEEYATKKLACDWDNVGLLVEPSKDMNIERILLTNDLTEPVLNEAIQKKVNMIISYHPPIFTPFKRLSQSDWKQRLIIKCIEQEIAVFSPHTSWDSIEGGINDYLLKPFGNYTLMLKLYCTRAFDAYLWKKA